MNPTLFASCVPILNGYLNADVDNHFKTWLDVVHVFFEISANIELKLMAELALTFDNASRPNHFRIPARTLEFHFKDFEITKASLVQEGLIENVAFIDDESRDELRLTFNSVRRLVFTKGKPETIEAFEFIDGLYQIHSRYELTMMHRSKRTTHWTLLRQIGSFNKSMQPHQTGSFRIMNTQPIVLAIVKGSRKKILAQMNKLPDSEKYSVDPVIPILESMVSSVDAEIEAIVAYVNETHALPYRERQLDETTKLSRTKQCIKFLKNSILIDPDQTDYTLDMLIQDINMIRMRLKRGQPIARKLSERDNTTNIKKFIETNGKYFDDRGKIELHPHPDDVSVIEYDESFNFAKAAEEAKQEVEHESVDEAEEESKQEDTEESEDETDAETNSTTDTYATFTSGRSRTNTQDTSFSSVVDELVDEEDEEEEEEKPTPPPKSNGKGEPMIHTPASMNINTKRPRSRSGCIPRSNGSVKGRTRSSSINVASMTSRKSSCEKIQEVSSEDSD